MGTNIRGKETRERHTNQRTDQLIELLVADLDPVDYTRISRASIIASLIGSALAIAAMLP